MRGRGRRCNLRLDSGIQEMPSVMLTLRVRVAQGQSPLPAVVGAAPTSAGGRMIESPQKTLDRDDESLLVSEAKAGNYAAFESLVNRYEKKIYRLGLNITGNPEDAEDVLQETFLKAFKNLAKFREDSRFYTWIVRIAVNEGLMKLRKRRSDKSLPMEDVVSEEGEVTPREFADWKPDPEQLLGQKEVRDILQNAAQALPPTYRTAFFLRDVDGLSTEETARALNLTVSAVKARLFRARLQLREELSKIFKRE